MQRGETRHVVYISLDNLHKWASLHMVYERFIHSLNYPSANHHPPEQWLRHSLCSRANKKSFQTFLWVASFPCFWYIITNPINRTSKQGITYAVLDIPLRDENLRLHVKLPAGSVPQYGLSDAPQFLSHSRPEVAPSTVERTHFLMGWV